ncbi:AraC family transcriptional regulator [Robiginitalea sp. IMCC43444]|uniref:AraC family transcriptional regulator n=1 Tax=Robiginitalea sp. IMCC43444 TaxID=3459121 RepID=UPI0040438FDA
MKKILIGTLAITGLALVSYLFIYPYDYIVRFKADTFPGTINQSIKLWHDTAGVMNTEVEQEDLYNLQQQVQVGDSVHIYNWSIEPLTDSTSTVVVKVKDPEHSLMNKIKAPFGASVIEKATVDKLEEFLEGLEQHLSEFRVTIVGEEELKSTYYAYTTISTTQLRKAAGMMDNIDFLGLALTNAGVELNGTPFVEVTEWNQANDSITFNFCFPIIRSEKLPNHPRIKYKRLFEKKALKAIYNGNYITSDRAWYALSDYAERNDISVELNPIEFFYNNPNMGGDALKWRADVYLPIAEIPEE